MLCIGTLFAAQKEIFWFFSRCSGQLALAEREQRWEQQGKNFMLHSNNWNSSKDLQLPMVLAKFNAFLEE